MIYPISYEGGERKIYGNNTKFIYFRVSWETEKYDLQWEQ